jgi:V/A-type H+-transporting ATPase subunit C
MSEQYAHAVGRVRAKEARLLDRAKIDRMAEAGSAEDALKVLSETEYSDLFSSLAAIRDFDSALDRELHRVYREMRRFAPAVVNIFALRFDYHNLKVLFKAHKLGEKRDDLLLRDMGNIPVEELARAVSEDDYGRLPSRMRQAARQVSDGFRVEPDPQAADMLLDRAMYSETAELVAGLDSPLLGEYFVILVDLLNLKTYLRIKRANRPKELLEQALLPGGRLDLRKVTQLQEPLEVLTDRLTYSPYSRVIEEGIQSFQKTDTLTRFEKLADDFLLKHVKRAKYATFGPDPLVGYLLAKENEIKLIRIILVGKINRLPNEEIKERLRDVYV